MPNVIDNEDLYNVIVLGGVTSPGVVTLSGHDRKVTWDVQQGPFLLGARTTLKAIPPIEFTATFYLVKDVAQAIDDFALWPAFEQVIKDTIAGATPGPFGKPPKPKDIYHPDLASRDIKSVAQASLGGMQYDGHGGARVAVKFQEYKPPRAYGGTALGSNKNANDPNADVKAEVQRLTNQYQKTPWG